MMPLSQPWLGDLEREYVRDALASGWISGTGPYVERLESSIAERIGRTHVIAVSSGTTALELALAALGIGRGDEVIVPALTFAAPAAAVLSIGATPVLCDVSKVDWTIDPAAAHACLGPRTRAAIEKVVGAVGQKRRDLPRVLGRFPDSLVQLRGVTARRAVQVPDLDGERTGHGPGVCDDAFRAAEPGRERGGHLRADGLGHLPVRQQRQDAQQTVHRKGFGQLDIGVIVLRHGQHDGNGRDRVLRTEPEHRLWHSGRMVTAHDSGECGGHRAGIDKAGVVEAAALPQLRPVRTIVVDGLQDPLFEGLGEGRR